MNLEINKQRERLKELEAAAFDCNAKLSGMPHGTGISDRTGRYGVEIAELKTLIKLNIQKCFYEQRQIERYIDSLPDAKVRLIFRLRYINHLTWDEIGIEIGYTERQAIRIHNKHIKKDVTKCH